MLGPIEFRFLNEAHSLQQTGWNPSSVAKLWVYNLHYFSDLCAAGAEQRTEWHRALLHRWILENEPGSGNGWEPYPSSLRIVNWIKWALAGNALSEECTHSLAVQVRWLSRRLEWHILGNHLFVNAKALVFAGLFFEGAEAAGWLETGLSILNDQIAEQVLADGGQFERSPMYHALALEDMLDLCNVMASFPGAARGEASTALAQCASDVSFRIQPMRRWLATMSHPDGEISFFNDAAIGIAPAPAELDAYARRLGFGPMAALADGVHRLPESGYIRVQRGPMVALLDVAPIGPDYLPGHAHADTLSFELSLHGVRALVNSGTSQYGAGPERQRQRGTAAHNTVVVNGTDSSEVWGGFRVARRAKPFGLSVREQNGETTVTCSHNGYRRLRNAPMHERAWKFGASTLSVEDRVPGAAQAKSIWHFGPNVQVSGASPLAAVLPGGRAVRIYVEGASTSVSESTVHPEFGMSVPASVLTCNFAQAASVRLEWN